MENENLIYEYQQMLLDEDKTFPSGYFTEKNADHKRKNEVSAIAVIKYAIENLLGWTPEQMQRNLNYGIICKLRLRHFLDYIDFQPEVNVDKDFDAIAAKIYPDRIRIDERALVIKTFERALSGEISKLPKAFFEDKSGRDRAIICLNYVISQKCVFNDIQDVYAFFVSPQGKRFIQHNRLSSAQRLLWESPLDYIHDSLNEADRNEVWFHYYKLFEKLKTQHKSFCN